METDQSLQQISEFVKSIQPGDAPEESGGRSLLAFGAALLWPGFAQLIAGEIGAAIFFALCWAAIAAGVVQAVVDPEWLIYLLVLIPFAAAVQVMQIGHATRCVRRSTRVTALDPAARMGIGLLFAVAAIGGYWWLIKYVQREWVEFCYSPTPSMSPAVSPGDLFLNYKKAMIHRWDIAGIRTPEDSGLSFENLCKRVVGMPGDRVEITGDQLLINSKPTETPPGVWRPIAADITNQQLVRPDPINAGNGCWGRPITLGSDEYYVLGDNSAISHDSRFWLSIQGRQPGAVPKSQLCGRVTAIIWPPSRWRIFPVLDKD